MTDIEIEVFRGSVEDLIDKAKTGSSPLSATTYLLNKVGCNTQMQADWYRGMKIKSLYVPPPAELREIALEGLATVSDYYGTRDIKGTSKHLAIMLFAMAQSGNWRKTLDPGHDPHALAKNILTLLLEERVGLECQVAVMEMATEWLCVDRPALFALNDLFESPRQLQRSMVRAMFGDAWWDFVGPGWTVFMHGDRTLDLKLLMGTRPPFLPGLIPGAALEASIALPDMAPG